MRSVLSALLVLLSVGVARSEEAAPACGTDVLGVSRTAEIDTTGGPRFGDQYPPETLLQPGEVVLTFDDGPHPTITKEILDALAAQCTKATFFNVGEMVKHFPDVAREVQAQGHTIGTHTWSHANLGALSSERGKAQIENAIAEEARVLPNAVAPFFRFPYLSDPKRMRDYLASRNIAVFSTDVDSLDYRTRTADRVVSNVMNGLAKTGGGIILFHDIHEVTARALPKVLSELKAHNFKVVRLVPKTSVQPVAMAEPPASDPAPAPRHHRRYIHRHRSRSPA